MKLDKIDNKKRRIKKKLYLGEFAVIGFEVRCQTKLDNYESSYWYSFINEFFEHIEGMDLCFGGGGLETFEGFICPFARYGTVTKEQRDNICEWLKKRAEVIEVNVSELMDANCG